MPRTAPDPAGRRVEGGRGLSKGEGGGRRTPRRRRKRGGAVDARVVGQGWGASGEGT
jgi:hypothetical protein